MSKNVQQGLEDVWSGRPEFDDPHMYTFVHETVRSQPRTSNRKLVVLCFECLENPRRTQRNADDHPLRCDECEYKHKRRVQIAAKAKG